MEALFDTHAHLDFPQYNKDREEVIARARNEGVQYIVAIGAGDGLDSSARAIEIAQDHEYIWATVGVHPHEAKLMTGKDQDRIRELAGHQKVVAIGEIGLDFAKEYSPREVQLARFREQLAVARELNMPVVIHNREAHGDIMRILKDDGISETGGVMHCYSGSPEMALDLLRMGFYISFPGVITFKNAKQLPRVAREIPEDRILIETDSPFLAPEPYRGKRNEPAYVRLVAEAIARIREVPFESIARITTENAFKAFNITKQID